MPILKKKSKELAPGKTLVIGFFLIIIVGAFLLCLPFSAKNGNFTDFVDCLFTAASATCVTGISVVETYIHWSVFGQCVIMTLIQIGGLGFLTVIAFVSGIMVEVNNKMELDEERLVALAVNTSIAKCFNSENLHVNLLTEYKTLHTGSTLTAATCMSDKEFLRYAAKRVRDTIKYMAKMSKLFNVDKYETFTDSENLVVEVLTEFASAMTTYLESDTYHKELVALPRFEEVPYWQGTGAKHSFTDTSTIDVKHSDFVTKQNTTGEIKKTGIICFLHDVENVAAYFGNRSSWDVWNPRSEVAIHGEKARKGFAIDGHANSIVFYVADAD